MNILFFLPLTIILALLSQGSPTVLSPYYLDISTFGDDKNKSFHIKWNKITVPENASDADRIIGYKVEVRQLQEVIKIQHKDDDGKLHEVETRPSLRDLVIFENSIQALVAENGPDSVIVIDEPANKKIIDVPPHISEVVYNGAKVGATYVIELQVYSANETVNLNKMVVKANEFHLQVQMPVFP